MDQNKKYFTDFLCGSGTKNVIFEPFINRNHTETLIWRRGEHLWSTPTSTLETLISLSERTQADVVFADVRGHDNEWIEEILSTMEKNVTTLGLGLICNSSDAIMLAERSPSVCCLALYGELISKNLPVIRMDGSIDDSIRRGDQGYFARDNAEKILASSCDIRILGGFGIENIVNGSPVEIYKKVRYIAENFPQRWACGSGGIIPNENYLELISLLGAFANIR